jgi:hypothetical protein
VAKQAAQRAWDQAIKIATAEEIIAGAHRNPLNGRTRTRNIPNTRQPGDGGCWMDEPVEREMNYAEMADTCAERSSATGGRETRSSRARLFRSNVGESIGEGAQHMSENDKDIRTSKPGPTPAFDRDA